LAKVGGGKHRHLVLEIVDQLERIAARDDRVKFTGFDAFAAVHAAVGIDVGLAVPDPDGLGGANPHAGSAAGAIVLKDLEGVIVFFFLFVHLT